MKYMIGILLVSASFSAIAALESNQEARNNKRPVVSEATNEYLEKRDERSIKVNTGEIAPYKTPHEGYDYSNIKSNPQERQDYSDIPQNETEGYH